MTEKEISWNKELNDWELCGTCLDIAMDAAYSDGFQYDDDDYNEYIYVGEESVLDDAVVATDLGLSSFVNPWSEHE
jgi:hypothetical protein